jgi:hypothetical protein
VRNTSGTVLPLGIPRIAAEVAEESGSRVPQSCCWETLHKVSGRTAQWNEAGACNACNGFLLGSIVTLKTPGPPFKMPCGTVQVQVPGHTVACIGWSAEGTVCCRCCILQNLLQSLPSGHLSTCPSLLDVLFFLLQHILHEQ